MIPRIIHFIFGLAEDFGGKPFSFIHYAAIKSAWVNNPGYKIRYYCKYEPTGMYWEVARRYVELVKIEPPAEIFGRRLHHVAHQADVLRLRYLIEQGGIYLDLDTVTMQSFEPLLQHQTVMGVQGRGNRIDGLCNAVMLSAPGAPFMKRWLDSYRSFRSQGRDRWWDEHSVVLPLKLAREHPDELTILDRGAFFYPSAEKQGIIDLFIEDRSFPAAYCHHLWEGLAWNLIKRLDERSVQEVNTSYNRMARRCLGDDASEFAQLRRQQLQALMQAPLRVNLGCGANHKPGWLNVDAEAATYPDLVFDITRAPWPLQGDSVVEVELSHALEQVGEGLETVMKELYRVCRHDARVTVRWTHPRSDRFADDPANTRVLLPDSFRLLDRREACLSSLAGDPRIPLALRWGVDFRAVNGAQESASRIGRWVRSAMSLGMGYWFMPGATKSAAPPKSGDAASSSVQASQTRHLARHLNNVVDLVTIELRVHKPGDVEHTPKAPGADVVPIAALAR